MLSDSTYPMMLKLRLSLFLVLSIAAGSAFAARGSISRKDFGLAWNQVLEAGGFLVGDRVDLTLDVQAVKAAAQVAGRAGRWRERAAVGRHRDDRDDRDEVAVAPDRGERGGARGRLPRLADDAGSGCPRL